MQVVRDPLRQTDLPRGGVGTIGNFDGVHLGHRKILETVAERARQIGRPSFAITFEPHPMAVLRPDRAPRRIQKPAPIERKLRCRRRAYHAASRRCTSRSVRVRSQFSRQSRVVNAER